MSYIDRNLLPGERILFRTRKHLIVFLFPVLWLIFAIYASAYMAGNPILVKLVWVPWFLAAILWGAVWLTFITSEFVVTDKRIMMREGFFFRHTNEMRVATISQVNVDQSLMGQLFDYGAVTINAFGVSDYFTMVAKPISFQRYVNQQLDQVAR